ncbi:MAG: 6-phosphogluconolactonase [Bacteroidetes bacterium]|nr:6-phosphogluconolactonase [Bacteroidota bacterium]MBU1114519.1 6-phosphogluconolactonase [Bacteroidota bacterium]MBU1799703.1 6-phosphogluconolactonase [Bacteroidota bacterium]
MNNEIKIFNNTDELSEYLGNFWKQKIDELESNKFYSIALSGGNTPIKIFNYLSENFRDKIDWNRIKFFWGDERCVPPSDNDSNYKLANDYLLRNVNLDESNIFRIKGEREPIEEAKAYSKIIEANLPIANGSPKFDFILLGLGEDGHTASIFPHEIELFSSQNYCEVAVHPVSGQKRITITGNIINNAETVTFVAIGKSKAERVFEIINKTKVAKNYPASLVNPINGIVNWFLDVESSSRL